jgi:hypothetical protein
VEREWKERAKREARDRQERGKRERQERGKRQERGTGDDAREGKADEYIGGESSLRGTGRSSSPFEAICVKNKRLNSSEERASILYINLKRKPRD